MADAPRKLEFQIQGLDCSEEIEALKQVVGPLVGGEEHLSFDLLNSRLTVQNCPQNVSVAAICKAVEKAGLKAEPFQPTRASETAPSSRLGRNYGRIVSAAASGLLTGIGFVFHVWSAGNFWEAFSGTASCPLAGKIFYGLAVICGGWFVFPKAWLAFRNRRPDMNLLMTVAVLGAIGLGEWPEAATVVFLFSVALLLESWSVEKSRKAIQALLDLSPQLARVVLENGQTEEKPVTEVPVGSVVSVRPWEKIPLDGIVCEGTTTVNQAPITGESTPVKKQPGETVFAGTINQESEFKFRTTRPADDTTLARIIRLIEEAHSRRAPSEQWVETFAKYYTPAMMALALTVAVFPPLLLGTAWTSWFYEGLVILVIACPCALVISTPVSIVAGLASAARSGVLVKGGVYLELPARLKAVAFDKTGTLTFGRPVVQQIVPLNGHNEQELLERAAALEMHSNHPLARAIVQRAQEAGLIVKPAENFRSVKGKGATGLIDGRLFWIGSHRFVHELTREEPYAHQEALKLEQAGHSVVAVGNDRHVCGLISLADEVRPNASQVVRQLKQIGLQTVVMLTGDNQGTAEAVGDQVGVDEVRAELLPEDKVQAVEELVRDFQYVAMVGDGINDAPAMAAATLGIAMGAAGSDAAIETADIALMTDDLSKLPWLIRHSIRTRHTIQANIFFALAIKAVFMGLAVARVATLWEAIVADTGASLLVIFNSLRLLRRASTNETAKKADA